MRHRYSLTRGATLMLLLLMLAGCGGPGGSPAATPDKSGGAQSGGAATISVTTATPSAGSGGDTSATNSVAPTAPTANSSGNVSSGAGIDLATFDVCGLLTQDEVVSLMPNIEYSDFSTDFDPTSGTKTCTYGDGEGTGFLQLTAYTPNRWADEASITGEHPEPVQGLGDEAVTEALKYAQVLAVLVKGRAAFLLTVNPTFTSDGVYDKKQAREIVMQLAMKIIPRLR